MLNRARQLLQQLPVVAAESWREARFGARVHGRPVLAQAIEFAKLRRAGGQLGLSDYFDYQLYRDMPGGLAAKQEFAGWRHLTTLERTLNDPDGWKLVRNKLAMYARLVEHGVAVPKVLAVYGPKARAAVGPVAGAIPFPGAVPLTTPEALRAHMVAGIEYPFFVKPVVGELGEGARSVMSFDERADELVLGSGERLAFHRMVDSFSRESRWVDPAEGYVFQELVQQHEDLARLARHVCTLRLVGLFEDGELRPYRAALRIVVGRNMTDNFDSGTSGNMLAEVDAASGRIVRAVRGIRQSMEVVETHPDTGVRLTGLQLPMWEAALDCARRGAKGFPMLQLQHWDIAFTPSGPVVLETNVYGSVNVHQVASGKGFVDAELRDFMARRGTYRPVVEDDDAPAPTSVATKSS